ncbi:TonB-dependent receptor plug domain-containing protein [Salipiger mucosus]|uniref:Putative TonB dependent Vitamin B12 outer membrane receptor n=1 Tax=Salipiger mucosus DSM 16094 TaxID=1123237 RepID=S9RVZ7_9RHOB|nr:TonB-dependent receptor [Salipiger mucosus]EPX82180.1 Putative TonB dependent Vitamin B12 outer membrane receptor [Salipiger mucosus DSM 16094]
MTRILTTVSALALGLGLPPQAAQAQEDAAPVNLGTLTLYANLTEFRLSRTGSAVELLTEEELDRAPETTLADRLDRLPGVTSAANGGPGQTASVSLRGLPNRYAPVYINGIEATDTSAPQAIFNFGNVLPGGIARAEVVKGSQSALYGSEAVGGIVALDTVKAPDAPGREGKASAEVGSFGTRNATLSYGIADERSGLAMSLSHFATDGYSAVEADGYDEDDGFSGTQLGFDGYYDATDALRLGLSGFYTRVEGDYDANGAPDPEAGDFDSDSRGLRAYAELQTGAVLHELSLSRYLIDRTLGDGSFDDDYDSRRDVLAYTGTWEIDADRSFTFGADTTREAATFSAAVYDASFARVGTATNDEDVTTTGVFAEYAWAVTPEIDTVLSLRHDDHSEFGGETTGRAALSWRATEGLTLRATLATGYRAPSLYELYDPTYGNDGIDPETSRSAEIGADYAFANGATLGGTLFYTEIDELIDYSFAAGGYDQVDGTTVSQGLELSGSLPLGQRVDLTGGFTYTDVRDANDDPLQRVPRYDVTLGLDARITDRLSGGLSVTHKADFPDTYGVGFAPEPVDDYTVVNARMGYTFDNGTEAYLRIENLTDEQYNVVPDYQTSDRAAYFGIRASF